MLGPTGHSRWTSRGHPCAGATESWIRRTRVVFTWGFAGSDELPPGSSTVEVRFSKEAGGTRVELVHRGLPPSRTVTHAAGWRRFLDRLALAGNTSGVDSPPIG